MIAALDNFAPAVYWISTWYKLEVMMGAILSTGKMGRSHDGKHAQYHQVLSRASWSELEAAAKL